MLSKNSLGLVCILSFIPTGLSSEIRRSLSNSRLERGSVAKTLMLEEMLEEIEDVLQESVESYFTSNSIGYIREAEDVTISVFFQMRMV